MNRITLRGFVTKQAQKFEYGQDKKLGVNFTIAVESGYGKGKVVDYFDCSRTNMVTEKLISSLKAGTHVLVSGACHIVDRGEGEAKKRYVQVYVDDFEFLPSYPPKKAE